MSTEKHGSELVSAKYSASDLGLKLKPTTNTKLHKPTLKTIHNAWEQSAIIDNYGEIWIQTSKLHSILRTNTNVSRYLLDTISDKYKVRIQGANYVRGCEIIRLIDRAIQSAGSLEREDYIRFSESYYLEIRDSDKAKLIRAEFYEYIKKNRRKLKNVRVSRHSLKLDELTNQELIKSSSEFSHIRSVSAYPRLADQVWNGLIVNKGVHSIITNEDINDESQLLELCKANSWNLNWYSDFLDNLDTYQNQ
jgi:hypothetical protein